MKALSSLLIVAVAVVSSHAYAACTYPKAPEKLPDGATASQADMVSAMKTVQAYNADIKAYTDCLRNEHDQQLADDAKKPEKDRMTKQQKDDFDKVTVQKNNAAVDEAESVTTRFNEQIRAFKAKSSDKKS